MNYILQLKAFEDWNECNYLTGTEEILWYKLMALNNKFGWSEWFFCTNLVLMTKAKVSENTLIKVRNQLKQKGLIDFFPGKKGHPTRYKIVNLYTNNSKFTSIYEVNREVKVDVFSEVNDLVKSSDKENVNLKLKNLKENQDISATTALVYQIESELKRSLSILECKIINQWIQCFSMELIEYAIRKAVLNGTFKLSYIERILENFKINNVQTLAEAKALNLSKGVRVNGAYIEPNSANESKVRKSKRFSSARSAGSGKSVSDGN